MRCLVFALAFIASVTAAAAGDFDYPVLRGTNMVVPGPANYTRWSGFYGGGFVGLGSGNFDFSTSTQDLLATALRETALENEQAPSSWQVLGKSDTRAGSFGGFIGYNTQWDDVVVGLELGYTQTSLSAIATASPITRTTSAGGNSYVLTLDGSANMTIHNYFSAKTRLGYAVKNLLPFLTVGGVLGRADYARSATASGTETHPDNSVTPFSFTESEAKTNALLYGWTAGAGIDVAVLPFAFVRGEVEYTRFFPVGHIQVGVTSGRLAVGVKY